MWFCANKYNTIQYNEHWPLCVLNNAYQCAKDIIFWNFFTSNIFSFTFSLVSKQIEIIIVVDLLLLFVHREMSLKKGDTVYLLRQVDANWFKGERHGAVGIFPVSYVEVQ